jgi:signal transduction histidine kinase
MLVDVKTFLMTPVSRRSAQAYLYAAVSAPLGLFGFVYGFAVLSVSGVLAVTLIGLPLIAAGLFGARLLGQMQRWLARRLLGVEIAAPPPVRRPHGLLARLGAALTDWPGWRAMVYQFVRTPVAVAYAVVLFWGGFIGVMALTYPLTWLILDPTTVDRYGAEHQSGIEFGDHYVDSWPLALLTSLVGIVILLATPWVLRVVTFFDSFLIRGLLGPTGAEQRILDLTARRAHAVDDSAAALRRIERDLHDGAQAQLVALAMQLGEARETLDDPSGAVDLAETRALIETAHRNAKQAINELRDLARGIHPPALDNGLADALGTLASRTTMPVGVAVTLRERPSAAVESIVYFCTAELLTNAVKHGQARSAEVEVAQLDGARLRLRVADDGRGGAVLGYSGGLAGLVDRAGTVDGTLRLDSPEGGPTVVTIELPMGV